ALVVVGGLVADAEETRGAIDVVERLDRPGERHRTRLPSEVAGVEAALDALLEIAGDEPLAVLRWIAIDADASAPTEVLAVEDIGSGDALDLAAVVDGEEGRKDPESHTALRIDVDLRNRNERRGRRIEPALDTAGPGGCRCLERPTLDRCVVRRWLLC